MIRPFSGLIINTTESILFHNYRLQNNYHKMSAKTGLQLNQIIGKLQNIAPLNLAESWDNVGLLVEPESNVKINSILLTIDLTEDVVEEAVQNGSNLIVSYHPNIFKPLKTLTQSTWKERIIVQCIKNNIAVFSPHTSWDCMENGINDWLGSFLPIKTSAPIIPNNNYTNLGNGRLLTLQQKLPLKEIINNVKTHIGIPHVRLGLGRFKNLDSQIETVALCAGSGASVLDKTSISADLYLTGEMTHHEVLEATQKGISVILCNHSDSERGYLKIMQKILSNDLELTIRLSQIDKDCLTTI